MQVSLGNSVCKCPEAGMGWTYQEQQGDQGDRTQCPGEQD